MGQFGVQVVENLFAKLQAIIQHPQCILAHRLTFEKFWETVAEIKAGLDFASSEWNAKVEVAQQQPSLSVDCSATSIQKPRLAAGGICVQQQKQLFLQPP